MLDFRMYDRVRRLADGMLGTVTYVDPREVGIVWDDDKLLLIHPEDYWQVEGKLVIFSRRHLKTVAGKHDADF